MRYLLLVSHGTFAPGLHSVLRMLAGERNNILSCSLEDGMSADAYVERLKETVAPVTAEDEVILLGDIIGGSPLTNALNVLAERGMLARTRAFGGMNLPMAMTAAMDLDGADLDELGEQMLAEAHAGTARLELAPADDADGADDDI